LRSERQNTSKRTSGFSRQFGQFPTVAPCFRGVGPLPLEHRSDPSRRVIASPQFAR